MPYVLRDALGNIQTLSDVPQSEAGKEFLEDNDPEVLAFFTPPVNVMDTFNNDVIYALTGTPAEQASAKSRLQRMKLDG